MCRRVPDAAYRRSTVMNEMIPNNPMMLLSFVNMKLRDDYDTLGSMCHSLDIDEDEVLEKLGTIGYRYNKDQNQFK